MRTLAASTLAILLLSACPADDDTDTGGSATMTTTMTGGESGSSSGAMTTAPSDSSGDSSGGGSSGGMAGPPVINSITWTQADGCTPGTGSDVDVVVDVTDPDNDVSELTFTGTPIGCTGDINAPMVTIVCPQVATYMATVKVEDPDGNSDMLPIAIMVCADGMAP